jgi:hypothetical protein
MLLGAGPTGGGTASLTTGGGAAPSGRRQVPVGPGCAAVEAAAAAAVDPAQTAAREAVLASALREMRGSTLRVGTEGAA